MPQAPAQTARFRAAVDAPSSGLELESILAALRGKRFDVLGEQVKTTPRGYAADHPRIETLRHKELMVMHDFGAPAWLGTKRALNEVRDTWRSVRPLTAGWRSTSAPTCRSASTEVPRPGHPALRPTTPYIVTEEERRPGGIGIAVDQTAAEPMSSSTASPRRGAAWGWALRWPGDPAQRPGRRIHHRCRPGRAGHGRRPRGPRVARRRPRTEQRRRHVVARALRPAAPAHSARALRPARLPHPQGDGPLGLSRRRRALPRAVCRPPPTRRPPGHRGTPCRPIPGWRLVDPHARGRDDADGPLCRGRDRVQPHTARAGRAWAAGVLR